MDVNYVNLLKKNIVSLSAIETIVSYMVTRIIFTIILFFSLVATSGAYEIMVLRSGNAVPYVNASVAFEKYLNTALPGRGLKSIQSVDLHMHAIGKDDDRYSVVMLIEQINPDIVVAIGRKALAAAVVSGKPIVYLLVPNAKNILPKKYNATGVHLDLRSGGEFFEVIRFLPEIKRVGIVYDPKNAGNVVSRVKVEFPDLTFITVPITSPKEVVSGLASLNGKIDLLWMVADLTAVTPQTEQSYYRFSLEQQVPLLTFSQKYLSRGATIGVVFDVVSMGEKAAESVVKIIGGSSPRSIPLVHMDRMVIKMNKKTADKINFKFAVPVHDAR